MEDETTTLGVENPLSADEMLQAEEAEDEEIIDAVVGNVRSDEQPPLPLLPPLSPPPPPPPKTREEGMNPQARDEEPRTRETLEPQPQIEETGTSGVRSDPPVPSLEIPSMTDASQPSSSSSSQADDLLERV